jgi:hypothetical protein
MATPIASSPVSFPSPVTNTKTETSSNNTTVNSKMKVGYKGGEYVLDVLPNDVLLGRGSGPNDHEGNIKFRDMISHRKQEYRSTSNRQSKALIAKEIADQVYEKGGRFLRKLNQRDALKQLPILLFKLGITKEKVEAEEDSAEEPREIYEVQNNTTVLEKAKQALRQNIQNHLSPTTSPMGGRRPANSKSPMKTRTSSPPKNNLSFSGSANAQANAMNGNSNSEHFNAWNNMGTIPTPFNKSGLGGSSTSFNINNDALFQIPPPAFTINNNVNQNHLLTYAELLHRQQQQQQQQQFIASQGQGSSSSLPLHLSSSSLQYQQQQQQQLLLYQQQQQLERQNALLQQQQLESQLGLQIERQQLQLRLQTERQQQSQSQQQSHQQGGPIMLIHRHHQHTVSTPLPVVVTSKSSSTKVADPTDVLNGYVTYTTTLDEVEEDKNNKKIQRALNRTSANSNKSLGDVTDMMKNDSDEDKSMQMSAMMESFKDISVKSGSGGNSGKGTDNSITRAMHMSIETIGTIDNIPGNMGMHVGGLSMAHMSCISMISMTNDDSTDSLHKSKRNDKGGSEGGSATQNASWGAAGTAAATSGSGTNSTKACAAAIAGGGLGLGSITANKQRGSLPKGGGGGRRHLVYHQDVEVVLGVHWVMQQQEEDVPLNHFV